MRHLSPDMFAYTSGNGFARTSTLITLGQAPLEMLSVVETVSGSDVFWVRGRIRRQELPEQIEESNTNVSWSGVESKAVQQLSFVVVIIF